ncbi:MAG: tRNA pseudouridine(38-40) synthase TruA [Steroidobacteraceae bacterium]
MPRIALGLEYDGSVFAGWQLQRHATGVQSVLQSALSLVADEPITVIAAGRTDAGVHATMQVVHFDTLASRTERSWCLGANTNLQNHVCVLWAREVDGEFHARFGALSRSYRYVILNRVPRPAVLSERVCWVRQPLDAERMHRAAQHLVGRHDFSSFRAAECQSPTPIRHLQRIQVSRIGEYVVMDVTANAFLHHMVRNIAGVLIAVGRGIQEEIWPAQVLQIRDRAQGGVTAVASGLYLVGVQYPDNFALPSVANGLGWPPGPLLVEADLGGLA